MRATWIRGFVAVVAGSLMAPSPASGASLQARADSPPASALEAAPPVGGEAVPAASPVRLDSLLMAALVGNPQLRGIREAALASSYRVEEAGTLPDPMLEFGILNFGLPDFATDMPNSMFPMVKVTQRVPFPGKLDLRRAHADLSGQMAAVAVEERWWDLRAEVATSFYSLYALDRQIEIGMETLSFLEDLQSVAQALYAAGRGRQADVLRADVEIARLDGELRRMRAVRVGTAMSLNALLGRPAETEVGYPQLTSLTTAIPEGDTLLAWAEQSQPALRGTYIGVERSRKSVELASRAIWPDVTVGVQYGQRSANGEVRRMGSAVFGFSIPIHAGARQHAARDEALAVERSVDAELDARRAATDARIGALLAELDRAHALVDLYSREVLPEAEAMVESALSAYRAGTVDFLTILDAEMAANRFESGFHEFVADYGRGLVRLESTLGRELPSGPSLITEAR